MVNVSNDWCETNAIGASNTRRETNPGRASNAVGGTNPTGASNWKCETNHKGASRGLSETSCRCASKEVRETNGGGASNQWSEINGMSASNEQCETNKNCAKGGGMNGERGEIKSQLQTKVRHLCDELIRCDELIGKPGKYYEFYLREKRRLINKAKKKGIKVIVDQYSHEQRIG